MTVDWKIIGTGALWVGAVAHTILGVALLSDFGGALLESLLGLGVEGIITLQGVVGLVSLWALWARR